MITSGTEPPPCLRLWMWPTGQVRAGPYARRRRREFLDFMNELVSQHPGRQIHVILDNLNTHKPKRDHWLACHPNVHLHYTPTRASWLNQVECWFSILSRNALRGASFSSVRQLRQAIDRSMRPIILKPILSNGPKPSCILNRSDVITLTYDSYY